MALLCKLIEVVRVRPFGSCCKKLAVYLLIFLELLYLDLLLGAALVKVNYDIHFERVKNKEPSVGDCKH